MNRLRTIDRQELQVRRLVRRHRCSCGHPVGTKSPSLCDPHFDEAFFRGMVLH